MKKLVYTQDLLKGHGIRKIGAPANLRTLGDLLIRDK
jgi:hypothetical protein